MEEADVSGAYVILVTLKSLQLELFILQAARPTIDLLESMDIDYNVLGGGEFMR